MLLAALAAVIALIFVALAGVKLGHANDRKPTQTATPPLSVPRTAPAPTTSAPGLVVPPSDSTPGTSPFGTIPPPPGTTRTLDAVLPDLIAFVERTRGHKFKVRPVVKPLADQRFDDILRVQRAGSLAEIDRQAVTWTALGLLEPGTDLRKTYDTALAAGVLGFYVPQTKELYVQGEAITPLREAIIVHELTHALDDQLFDLNRLETVKDPDQAAAVLSLVEGSARRVEFAYRDRFSAADKASAADEEAKLGQGLGQTALTPSVLIGISAPYELGQHFVDNLDHQGGTRAIDAAFRRLPTTTEQISHPDKYRGREEAIPLVLRPPPETTVDQGTLGEFELRLVMLMSDPVGSFNPGSLDPANLEVSSLLPHVDSWGGGHYVSWKADDGRSCVRFVLLEQGGPGTPIRDALQKWSALGGRVTVRPDGKLVGERCA